MFSVLVQDVLFFFNILNFFSRQDNPKEITVLQMKAESMSTEQKILLIILILQLW